MKCVDFVFTVLGDGMLLREGKFLSFGHEKIRE
jgi:hypothetical protein